MARSSSVAPLRPDSTAARPFHPGALALALAAGFAAVPAAGQPSGAQAVHGTASLSQQGSQLTVTTTNGAGTSHSSINWQSFSVPVGTLTQFNQPSAASTSINRVVGSDPSSIYGTLRSNGRLVLVNPAGIAVGPGGMVDTAGFTASTLRMSDADALAGRLVFGGDGLGGGALQVDGQVVARSGDVVLISPNVRVGSAAVIQSPNGTTALVAGQKVELTGRGLEGIRLEVQAPADQAVNLGRLEGDAVGIFAGTLKHSGVIQATAVSAEGGRVVLKGGALADVGGQIAATRGSVGGQVYVTADQVILRKGATVDVSGPQGGGEALFGGGWQGDDGRVANAKTTVMETGSLVRANATDRGNGGTVVFWSDETTRVGGRIEAKGGPNGGNGGRVETSGKGSLVFRADIDTSAPLGSVGSILLDPQDIVITSGTVGKDDAILGDAQILFDEIGVLLDATISEVQLETLTGNVTLSASRDVILEDLVDNALDLAGAKTGFTYTLNAGRDIVWRDPFDYILVAGGDIVLNAAGGNISIGSILALGGSVKLNAAGNVAFDFVSATNLDLVSTKAAVAGRANVDTLFFNAAGSVNLSGSLGSVTGTAGGDVNIVGLQNVGVAGVFGGANVSLAATDLRSQQSLLTDQLLKAAPNGNGLTLLGNVEAKDAVNLAGQYVYVTDAASVAGAAITFDAPLAYVEGRVQPGGAGGIGVMNTSGDLYVAGTGSIQLDVASTSSFDQINVNGASTFDAGTYVKVNDLTGGGILGSFAPARIGAGAMTFLLPAGWTVSPAYDPYVINSPFTTVPFLESESYVITFQNLWEQEQQGDEKTLGKDDIVITDTQCKTT